MERDDIGRMADVSLIRLARARLLALPMTRTSWRGNVPNIGSLIVLSLLPLTIAGCSKAKESAATLVLEKACAATTEEVASFHFTVSGAATAEGMGEIGIRHLCGRRRLPCIRPAAGKGQQKAGAWRNNNHRQRNVQEGV